MNLEPALCANLLGKKQLTHALGKHFCSTAGHRPETSGFQLPQHFLDRHLEFLVEEVDLDGSKRLDIGIRIFVGD